MLGVQQDATHDELKDAYRNRALRLRGQRGPGSSDDEIERVEWRMGELNTAWEVLRDPRRRQAYDRQLVEVSEGAVRRPAPFADEHLAGLPQPEPQTADDEHEARGGRLWAPAVVIGVLLLVVIISASVASSPEHQPDVVTTEALPAGTCVRLDTTDAQPGEPARSPDVVPVDCAADNNGVIVATKKIPRPCPAGTDNVPLLDAGVSLCLRPSGG